MRRIVITLTVVCAWLVLITSVSVIGLILAMQSNNNIRTLLLNGKTASALSAQKTAQEVKSLIQLTTYDHKQSEIQFKAQAQGEKIINTAISDIEKHLDKTLKKDINTAVRQIEKRFLPHK